MKVGGTSRSFTRLVVKPVRDPSPWVTEVLFRFTESCRDVYDTGPEFDGEVGLEVSCTVRSGELKTTTQDRGRRVGPCGRGVEGKLRINRKF